MKKLDKINSPMPDGLPTPPGEWLLPSKLKDLIREPIAIVRLLFVPRNFADSLPVLILISLFVYIGLSPNSLYLSRLSHLRGGEVAIPYLGIIALLMLPWIWLNRKAEPLLVAFGCYFGIETFLSLVLFDASLGRAVLLIISCSLPFFYASLIKWSPFQIALLRWGLLGVLGLLGFQILAYGLGFLTYQSEVTGEIVGSVAGNVSRTRTTVGSATGSGVVVAMLGILVALLFRRSIFVFWIILILTATLTLVTFSRGPVLIVLSFGLFVFITGLASRRDVRRKYRFYALASAVVFLITLFSVLGDDVFGVWGDRLLVRQGQLFQDTARIDRYLYTLNDIVEEPIWGVGFGNYIAHSKLMLPTAHQVSLYSPHNVYLLIAVETGVLGLLVFLGLIACVIYRIIVSRNVVGFCLLAPFLLIGLNTEIVYLMSPYSIIWALILGFTLRKDQPKRIRSY